MLKELFVAISAVMYVLSMPSIALEDGETVKLNILEELSRGETWVNMAKMFDFEAMRYKLNKAEINNINKILAEKDESMKRLTRALGRYRQERIIRSRIDYKRNSCYHNLQKLRSKQLTTFPKNNACKHAAKLLMSKMEGQGGAVFSCFFKIAEILWTAISNNFIMYMQ
jgi:hypothetical protein